MESVAGTPISYTVCGPSDEPEMCRLLAEVFAERDPPAVAVDLTADEFEAFVRLLMPGARARHLSIVARSAETGEMVGALLAEDGASPMPEGLDRLSSKFDPIFDILGGLDETYRREHEIDTGEAVHVFLLGVAGPFAGRGIAQGLITECLGNAAARGYCFAVTEATNRTSQHIFRKLGFVERVHTSYADHRFDGRAAFASIAEHVGPILMDKELSE